VAIWLPARFVTGRSAGPSHPDLPAAEAASGCSMIKLPLAARSRWGVTRPRADHAICG